MSIKSLLTGHHSASAKVADGRLILSLPDAETPVLWVMDLDEAATAVIRLEVDKQGNNILKKYGAKAAVETVAVYHRRKDAENALVKASAALENARNTRLRVGPNSQPVIVRPASLISRLFTTFLYIWFVVYLSSALLGMFTGHTIQQPPQNNTTAATTTPDQKDMDAAGVPLSADDFLKNNKEQTPK